MADQDFRINIVTLADLTGIKLTQAELDALQKAAAEGNQDAIDALKKLRDAQKDAEEQQKKSNQEFVSGIRQASAYGFILGGAVAKAINDVANAENKATKEIDKQFESLVKNVQEWNKLAQVATTPEQLASIGEKAIDQIEQIQSKINEANQDNRTLFEKMIDTTVSGFKNAFTFGGDPNAKGPIESINEELVKSLQLTRQIAEEHLKDVTRTGLKEQQSAYENLNAEILRETEELEKQKTLLRNLNVNENTGSWIAQEKVVERLTARLKELLSTQKQLQQQGGPTTKAGTLEDQLNQLRSIGARTDLTPKESQQIRDAQIATENALRDEQIKRAREVTDAQTQAVRDRYEKGFQELLGQAGLPQGQIETNQALLNALHTQNTLLQELRDLWR